jgi:transposase-like protein
MAPMKASIDSDAVERRLKAGDTVEAIAADLGVTARTVRNHLNADGRPLQLQRRRKELQTLLLDPVWLHEQVVTNSRTVSIIARELRVPTEEVRSALESFGIDHPRRRDEQPPRQPELRRDALQASFDSGETVSSIARRAGVDRSGVRRAMRRQSVVNRHANDHTRPGVLDNPTWLHNRYIVEKATIVGLAAELGVAELTVRSALVRLGIQVQERQRGREIDPGLVARSVHRAATLSQRYRSCGGCELGDYFAGAQS